MWSRGVDTELFAPHKRASLDLPRPVALFVGRVAVEKNIEAFLDLELPGSTVVIGDGPDLPKLRARYPHASFLGQLEGEALAAHVAAADVFVFPSLTDTFGIVLLEAIACGVPIAAFPITGPIDVVENGRTGVLDWDLGAAISAALELDPRPCLEFARAHSWASATAHFASLLSPRSLHAKRAADRHAATRRSSP